MAITMATMSALTTLHAEPRRKAHKVTEAKADSLRALIPTAEITAGTDSLGRETIKIVLSGQGMPAEPNVTGYNAATQRAVETIAKSMTGRWSEALISVEGHTDNVGPRQENMDISIRRAAAIARLMVREGVDSCHVSHKGHGYEQPIADNRLAWGRERNRRVEIVITLPRMEK